MINYVMSFNSYEEFKKALNNGLIKPKEDDYYVILHGGGHLPSGEPIRNNTKLRYSGGSFDILFI